MHLKRRYPDEKPRPPELLHLLVLAENMAHILAQEAFNAFTKLLHPIHILLVHFPVGAGAGGSRKNAR
jgi:hypothetical protein